jgi:hypothetical protein
MSRWHKLNGMMIDIIMMCIIPRHIMSLEHGFGFDGIRQHLSIESHSKSHFLIPLLGLTLLEGLEIDNL